MFEVTVLLSRTWLPG